MASGRDIEDAGPPDEGGEPTARRPPRSGIRSLDSRTLIISVAIALVAAVLAGLLVGQITDGADDAAVADGPPGTGVTDLEPATEVPVVELTRFDGSSATFDDYRGHALVVNFWATWCAPCVREMPELQEVSETLGEQVTFVGVNVRDDLDSARALARRTGVKYDLVTDDDGSVAEAFGVVNFPTTVLVLPDGTIVETKVGQFEAADELEELVCEALLGGC